MTNTKEEIVETESWKEIMIQQIIKINLTSFFLKMIYHIVGSSLEELLTKIFYLPDVAYGIKLDSIANLLWFLECFNFKYSFGYIINITITFFAISLIYHIKG
mgnify:CR=1 FL=1